MAEPGVGRLYNVRLIDLGGGVRSDRRSCTYRESWMYELEYKGPESSLLSLWPRMKLVNGDKSTNAFQMSLPRDLNAGVVISQARLLLVGVIVHPGSGFGMKLLKGIRYASHDFSWLK